MMKYFIKIVFTTFKPMNLQIFGYLFDVDSI